MFRRDSESGLGVNRTEHRYQVNTAGISLNNYLTFTQGSRYSSNDGPSQLLYRLASGILNAVFPSNASNASGSIPLAKIKAGERASDNSELEQETKSIRLNIVHGSFRFDDSEEGRASKTKVQLMLEGLIQIRHWQQQEDGPGESASSFFHSNRDEKRKLLSFPETAILLDEFRDGKDRNSTDEFSLPFIRCVANGLPWCSVGFAIHFLELFLSNCEGPGEDSSPRADASMPVSSNAPFTSSTGSNSASTRPSLQTMCLFATAIQCLNSHKFLMQLIMRHRTALLIVDQGSVTPDLISQINPTTCLPLLCRTVPAVQKEVAAILQEIAKILVAFFKAVDKQVPELAQLEKSDSARERNGARRIRHDSHLLHNKVHSLQVATCKNDFIFRQFRHPKIYISHLASDFLS